MNWSRDKSLARIEGFLESVPQANVAVRRFNDEALAARRAAVRLLKEHQGKEEPLLFNVSPREAILVDGVHVYVQLIDYHNVLLDPNLGYETEASHSRLLAMLHLHYSGCDRVAETFEAQRVDYHGPRMHAVVVTPTGNARERARRALAFAFMLKRTIDEASNRFGDGRFRTRVRIGLDSGPAVAVNSGRSSEPEPLFLGNPANYAAKLAEGNQEGIFLSDRMRKDLGMFGVGGLQEQRAANVAGQTPLILSETRSHPDDQSDVVLTNDAALEDVMRKLLESPQLAYVASSATFSFHHHEPPLRSVKFVDLSPSNSIRMPLTSIFADLDKFTAYVDAAIAQGRVKELVSNLHVLRKEFEATLRDDFHGRKVRFIGDCLHGVHAEGTRTSTDEADSVRSAVRAAAGLRSSFELCQDILPGISHLGLAIGIELGSTPMTRLGIRGDRSVRCAVSKAISQSEALQSICDGVQTALGPKALAAAPAAIRRLFDSDGIASGLDFDAVEEHVAAPAIVSSGSVSRVAQPHTK